MSYGPLAPERITAVCKDAISHYGQDMQQNVALEKMAELTQAIVKLKGLKTLESDYLKENARLVVDCFDNLFEGIADVEIMLEQLKIMLDCFDEVKDWKEKKILRLEKNLKGNCNDN